MDNLDVNIMDKSMRSVFVGNIPYEATEEKLKEIFGEVGQVLSFKLVFDRETGKPKGYGFCEYRDPETALSAMRNLNGYEIGGRNLRVDNACTEKSRMEMQSLLNQPPVENPYGEPIQSEKAPEAISKAVASLPPEQMFELMKQMKQCVLNNPAEARNMLLQNPQLAYALLQAQVVMRIVDPLTACSMLHQDPIPSVPIFPNDKATLGTVPINNNFAPLPVQAPPSMRQEFPPLPPPVNPLVMNLQAPVFTGQDVDLRSMDMRASGEPHRGLPDPVRGPGDPMRGPGEPMRGPVDSIRGHVEPIRGPGDLNRGPDPRSGASRINNDQDMRSMPVAPPLPPMPNAVPQPMSENNTKPDIRPESMPRDPRVGNSPSYDPRQVRLQDPRQKMTSPIGIPTPVPPIRPPPQPPALPSVQPPMVPPVQRGLALSPGLPNVGASDQEKAALIMQVLQLSDEQIAMLPLEQRNSILVLKEQIAKSTQR